MKQKFAFLQKYKNMSTKQEIVPDAALKAWPFSSDFNFACKDGRVTTAICKYHMVALSIDCKPYHYQWLQKALF